MLRHNHNLEWEDHETNDSIREEAKIKTTAKGIKRCFQWYGCRKGKEENIRMVFEIRVQEKQKRGEAKTKVGGYNGG